MVQPEDISVLNTLKCIPTIAFSDENLIEMGLLKVHNGKVDCADMKLWRTQIFNEFLRNSAFPEDGCDSHVRTSRGYGLNACGAPTEWTVTGARPAFSQTGERESVCPWR
jgi:hypothetical protein